MHKSLLSNYLEIEKNMKTLYIFIKIHKVSKNNSYINLLYKDIINDDRFLVKDLSTYEYPKIILSFLKGEKSIVHHHWYDFSDSKSFSILLWKTFWLVLYKLLGGKIVWTIHNKYPHNKNFKKINIILRIFIAKISTKIHVHCKNATRIMPNILNVHQSKFFVVEHPMYEVNIYGKNKARIEIKNKYNIDIFQKKVYLMLGLVAEYKGIDKVAEIFKGLPNVILIIAGKTKIGNDIYKKKILTYNQYDNIYIIDKLIPNNDLDAFFNSCDYVLFNYNDILTSGGVVLAQSYNKKIIAPDKGCIQDIASINIMKFKSEGELKNIILDTAYDKN